MLSQEFVSIIQGEAVPDRLTLWTVSHFTEVWPGQPKFKRFQSGIIMRKRSEHNTEMEYLMRREEVIKAPWRKSFWYAVRTKWEE